MSDLSKLWLMLSFRLHGRAGAQQAGAQQHGAQGGAQRLSGVRLSWGEFQLVFGDSWHAMIVKRVFDIMDRDGDGVISSEDLPLALNPHLSPFTLTPALTPTLTPTLTPIRCDLIRGLCAWYFPARIGAGDLGRQAALSLPVPRPRRISRDLTRGRARASARLRCAVAVRRRLQPLARPLKLALTPLTLTLTLTLTLSLARCAADCSFSPEQLEALISATFASAELDSDGRIRRHSLTPLYG